MLTIITPCYRQKNLSALYDSIQFDLITAWIIVYDTSKDRTYPTIYEGHPKIMELECNAGIYGNPQRNHALSFVTDGYVYFLDDDNIIHPQFWNIIYEKIRLSTNKFYTFDQVRNKQTGKVLLGKNIAVGHIDTAMYLIHRKHIGELRWITDRYDADGHFICAVAKNNPKSHHYVNIVASYYNYID